MSLLLQHLSIKSKLCPGVAPNARGGGKALLSLSRSFAASSGVLRSRTGSVSSSYRRLARNQRLRFSTSSNGKSSSSSRYGWDNISKFYSREAFKKAGGDASRHASKTAAVKSQSARRWTQLAWIVRVGRLPVLIGSIYSLGYQQGVLDTVRNPNKVQQGFFETCCMNMGVESADEIDIVWEQRPPAFSGLQRFNKLLGLDDGKEKPAVKDARANQVASVGRDIIRSARQYIRDKLDSAIKQKQEELKELAVSARSTLDIEFSAEEVDKMVMEDEEVQKWINSYERIEGYTTDGIKNWQFILLHTSIPNAFVAEMLPQRVFATTGLFDEFVSNEDELAMIMGHELAHLVLGHGSDSVVVEFMLRGLEIAILMLDPTEGLLSLGLAAFLAQTREALTANNSRTHEREADELGCTFAAMACYDTRRGCNVFRRMHEYDVKHDSAGTDIMSTHPASKERFEFVKKLSEEVNQDSYCVRGSWKTKLRGRALSLAHSN